MARRARLSALAVIVVVLSPFSAYPAQKPSPRDGVLPNVDIRLLNPAVPPPLDAEAQALLDQLRKDHPGLRTRTLGMAGGLRSLSADGHPLTPAASGSPEQIARKFLDRYHHLLGLQPGDLATLNKTREYRSRNENVSHVEFQQSINGLSVFGAQMHVQIAADGGILGVAHTTIPVGKVASAGVTAEDAVRAAIDNVRPSDQFALDAISGPSGKEQLTRFAHGPFKSDIEARLVVFPTASGLRVAWKVVLEPQGLPQKYEVLIDAVTRELLYRRNRVLYADGVGRVLQSDAAAALNPRLLDPHPFGAAAGGAFGCPPVTNHIVRGLTAPFRDSATVLFGAGRLQGNNVHVFRGAPDVEGAAGTSLPDGWHFDFTFNTADSAETGLFFLSNFLHDFFYDLGFDEAAGNFQESNFGRGGLEGDSLAAVARASGRNNATFEPNPDGQRSIMSMFLWDASGCWAQDVDGDGTLDLDGDFDTDIAIHEYHHGVSNRLNTQWTGIEADAMGEGGSDFFAYSINGDTTLAEYAYPPNGIRSVNGKTYGDFYCLSFFGFVICEPHDNGEVFADTLWDLRQRFRADGVGGSDAAAINMTHQLYVDGLKLSPPSPTMLDLRDAILMADGIRNPSGDPGGSRNHCRIWDVFATRGMGAAAQDTDDTGTAAVVEDFTEAPECPGGATPATVTVAATIATATEAGLQAGQFTVSRTGDTSRALTVYFSVGGTATAGSDYASLPSNAQFPAGAATVPLAVTPIDDSLVEPNETVVLTLTGSVGYRVGSPSAATVSIISDDVAPDLTVSALTVPGTGGAGASIAVTATTKNQGTGSAAASNTRFYLSTNPTVDAADTVLGSSAIPSLASAATFVSSATLTIPASTASGTYYVLAQADGDGTVTETSETNNVRSGQIRIGPDLNISAFSVPPAAAAGATIVVTDTTKNSGGGAAPASVTRFYFSTNTTYEAADTLIGSRDVGALAAGATSVGSTSVVIPASATTGSYFIVARADGADAIVESVETNNTSAASVRIGPDLSISSLSVSGSLGAGGTITVNDTTKNSGGSASDTSVTRFYLSTNTTLDASDQLLGSRAVPALAAGASSAASTSVTIPAGTATGTYYIVAQADALATNAETNETNNNGFSSIRIGPDLTISGLTGNSTVGAGGTITVTETTRNAGGGSAGPSSTRYYFSTNSTVDASDVPLGSRSVPALAPGATSANTVTLTIPASTATGNYYLIAQADADGAVAETLETNNIGYLTLRVGPDLIVTNLTVPTSAGAGSAFSVTDTTKNQGGGSAGTSTTRFYLSTNSTFDASDILLGGRGVGVLAANATVSGSTGLVMPAGTAAGTHYIIAVADGDGGVAETTETNNTRAASITVK